MNKRQARRLLNVARALREYEHPERFDMNCYVYNYEYLAMEGKLEKHEDWCGTPGCALGTYASRSDLQRVLRINECITIDVHGNRINQPVMVLASKPNFTADYNDVLEHFGINDEEAEELFDHGGCGNAQTPIEAAKYIENFVAKKLVDEHAGSVLQAVMGYTPFGQ